MIANGYCTLNDLKARLEILDANDDAMLEQNIEAASRIIDGMTGVTFFAATESRTYTASTPDRVRVDALTAITAVATDDGTRTWGTVWDSGDYELDGATLYAIGRHRFPLGLRRGVQVTGTFGFAVIPHAIREAAILVAARLYKRKDTPLGIQTGKPEFGNLSIPGRDPDVERLVQPFRAYDIVGV